MTSQDRHRAVEVARTRADLTVQQLWLRYVALGGTSDAFEVDGFLQGMVPLEAFQQDVLAQAVNEALEEVYRSLQVPLSTTPGDGAADGALADVIDLLLTRQRGDRKPATPPAGDAGQPPARPTGAEPGG